MVIQTKALALDPRRRRQRVVGVLGVDEGRLVVFAIVLVEALWLVALAVSFYAFVL